ncbi:MAG: hypothetical protein MUC49_03655 [Raineya sp.]|jgi:hypothetical protein|nr:hypothetical protein [Raineya sp.]
MQNKSLILGFTLNIPLGFILWYILWYGGLGFFGIPIMIALTLNGYLLAWYWKDLFLNFWKKSLLGWFSMLINHFLFFGTEFFILQNHTDMIMSPITSKNFFSWEVLFYYPFCLLGFILFYETKKKGS